MSQSLLLSNASQASSTEVGVRGTTNVVLGRRRPQPPQSRRRVVRRLNPTTTTTLSVAIAAVFVVVVVASSSSSSSSVALPSSPATAAAASSSRGGDEYDDSSTGGPLRGGPSRRRRRTPTTTTRSVEGSSPIRRVVDGRRLGGRHDGGGGDDDVGDERRDRIGGGENDEEEEGGEKEDAKNENTRDGPRGNEKKNRKEGKDRTNRTKASKVKDDGKDEDEDEDEDGESSATDESNLDGHSVGKTDKKKSKVDDVEMRGETDENKIRPAYIRPSIGNKADKESKSKTTDDVEIIDPAEEDDKPVGGTTFDHRPFRDKETLLFALEYFGIEPEEFPNMTDEEREGVLMMMDGDLELEFAISDGESNNVGDDYYDDDDVGDDDPEPTTAEETPSASQHDGAIIAVGWDFVGSCEDRTIQLESFEDEDGIVPALLNGTTSAMEWTTDRSDPWSRSSEHAHDGGWSTRSGLTHGALAGAGSSPLYSNMTLTTEGDFDGGVLTFKLYAESLGLPREALFVTVDDRTVLTVGGGGGETMTTGGGEGASWVEYNVPVGYGVHQVKWVHVHNPFGLESLPPLTPTGGGSEGGGLWMDDVRYAPFTQLQLLQMDMINGNCGVGNPGALWKAEQDDAVVSVSTSHISSNADITFALYSERGGILTYGLHTSTTAPMDDFAIILNDGGGEITADAIFGDMVDFESKSLSIPSGKVSVTLRHRKDPGKLGVELLGSLGEVTTTGTTRLKDLRFQAY